MKAKDAPIGLKFYVKIKTESRPIKMIKTNSPDVCCILESNTMSPGTLIELDPTEEIHLIVT